MDEPDCDFVLTNPPFGTSESESLPASELDQFPVKTSKGQNLFLQKMILSTKADGLICTVIDEGVLNTDSSAALRGFMLSTCKLLLVIQLPDETFKPNKINVRSSVLLLQRREADDASYEDSYPITFCRLESLGYNGSPTHTAHDVMLTQKALPVFTGELRSLVGVQKQAGPGLATPHCS